MWLLGVVVRRYDILMDGRRTVRVTPEYEDTLTYGGWGGIHRTTDGLGLSE